MSSKIQQNKLQADHATMLAAVERTVKLLRTEPSGEMTDCIILDLELVLAHQATQQLGVLPPARQRGPQSSRPLAC